MLCRRRHRRRCLWCTQQKAVVALVRAQALVDHSRNGAAAKQAARDAASGHKADVELEMQVRSTPLTRSSTAAVPP